jgi:diguanylate cyclase (GGDEF)-like protein
MKVRPAPTEIAASSDMSRFLDAAAQWLGASVVRIVGSDEAPAPEDRPGTAASEWLSAGAAADGAVTTVDDDLWDFAPVTDADGEVTAALLVQRPHHRPRPAAQGERIRAVAALAGRLLDAGAGVRDEARPTVREPYAAVREEPESVVRRRLADATRKAGRASVFAIVVDRLAVVNEVFGREFGDVVLQAVDARLAEWAGLHATVVRLSGTRFGVMRADLTELDAAVAAAHRLRDLLAAPVPLGELRVSRSVSIGVAVGAADEAPDLVTRAVRGSLAARESGGDAVRTYDVALVDERLGRLRLELELDDALRTGQLCLHYQPEFDLRSGQLLAVEALLRWEHPRLGMVRADAFVDDTERTRTFAAVQLWVIEEACRQLAGWQALPGARGLGLRINVSAWQIARGGVADKLLATIERYGLAAESVCVELTERRMPRRVHQIAEALELLSSRGVSIAIDDFGTGQGTVSQLTTLPVDTIKIDQSFVVAMRTDPRAEAVVAGVIALADSLTLETVAEGVDGADTAARLVQLGCTRGQGNSLGEAMPGDQVATLLRR